jgi:hypothetical protein
MNDREQRQRERAYEIWGAEGRVEGTHLDHWQRAWDQHATTEEEADAVTEVNEEASDEFNEQTSSEEATDIRRPSTVTPD